MKNKSYVLNRETITREYLFKRKDEAITFVNNLKKDKRNISVMVLYLGLSYESKDYDYRLTVEIQR